MEENSSVYAIRVSTMYPVNKRKFNILEWMDSDYNMDEQNLSAV